MFIQLGIDIELFNLLKNTFNKNVIINLAEIYIFIVLTLPEKINIFL